jgi:hypothetical protein
MFMLIHIPLGYPLHAASQKHIGSALLLESRNHELAKGAFLRRHLTRIQMGADGGFKILDVDLPSLSPPLSINIEFLLTCCLK